MRTTCFGLNPAQAIFAGLIIASTGAAAAQVTPYGSGVNPHTSLFLTGGQPAPGQSFTLGMQNSAVLGALPAFAVLAVSLAPDPGFPAGTLLANHGLAGQGAPGELLVSVAPPNPIFTSPPVPWGGFFELGTPPAMVTITVPNSPGLAGATLYCQGLLITPALDFDPGLTNGLAVQLGAAPPLPEMALLTPGTFMMGSDAPSGAPYYGSQATEPVHQVTITYQFWIGRYPVTQAEYEGLMGSNPSFFVGPNRPVDGVTWYDAAFYCKTLNSYQTALGNVPPGYQYRLPTEAEWEYACRAGTTTEFYVGGALLCTQAKFNLNHHLVPPSVCVYPEGGTTDVGSFAPNPWGLYDMHGNVWEWCLDGYSDYTPGPKIDPFVPPDTTHRVLRGGSFSTSSAPCRSAFRNNNVPSNGNNDRGLRVVLAPIL